MKLLEKHIAKACSDFLVLDGWRPIKMEPISRREWGKGTGEIGQPDYLYIRYSRIPIGPECAVGLQASGAQVLWIEWKRLRSKAQQHQLDWHAREKARGALTLIAGRDFTASIKGFILWYNQSGLERRSIDLQRHSGARAGDLAEQLGRIAGEAIAKCPK